MFLELYAWEQAGINPGIVSISKKIPNQA